MTELHISTQLSLPLALITESNGILGKKGSGKTSAGVVLFEEIYGVGVPVVAIDPKGDWYGIRSSADGKSSGLPVPVFGGLHGDIPLEASGGKALATLIREQHMSCILDVSEFSLAERRKFLAPFAEQLYRIDDRTPMHLILEEAHEYIPQRVDTGDAPMVGMFERLVKMGRSKGLGVTMMSQRSASLNKNVLTQADNLFVMRTTSPQDRNAIADWIKYEAGGLDILSTVATLHPGECWLYQPSRGEPVRLRFRMRRTFDAGATPEVGKVSTQPTNIADVDLTAVSAAMAETIQKAKDDDPHELRRRIAELTGTIKQQDGVIERLQNEKPEPEIRDVPAITPELEARLGKLLADLTDALNETNRNLVGAAAAKIVHMKAPARAVDARVPRLPMPIPPEVARRTAAAAPVGDGELRLGKAHRGILTVLAQRGAQTAQQVATLTEYSVRGGGFNNAVSSLRTSGFIEGSKESLQITPEGLEALGPFEPLPTGQALVDHWLAKFGKAERLILSELVEAWPNGLTKEDLAERTEYTASGGGFNNAISKLRGLNLISGNNAGLYADDTLGEAAHG